MPQFLVIAHDGTDAEAPARRQAVRAAHLEGVRPMVERGEIVVGGALLDEAGGMAGSAVIVDMPDRAGGDAWVARDPYVTGGVWRAVEVRAVRAAGGGGRWGGEGGGGGVRGGAGGFVGGRSLAGEKGPR